MASLQMEHLLREIENELQGEENAEEQHVRGGKRKQEGASTSKMQRNKKKKEMRKNLKDAPVVKRVRGRMHIQRDEVQRPEVRSKGMNFSVLSQSTDEGKKGKKTNVSDSDDAFESPPRDFINKEGVVKPKRKKQPKKRAFKELKHEYKSLYNRSSPHVIVQAIAKFNDKQREEVISIGFGAMLHLYITELPSKLGYWVVDNFDPRSCTMKVSGDIRVHVTDEDVENALGFPRGEEAVVKKHKHEKSELAVEWRKVFGGKEKITPSEVATAMINCKEGGEWFIRHFVVLLISSLIENTKSGYINYQFINCLRDTKAVKRMNWCEYVISALVEKKLEWEEAKDKAFTGPLLFLVVFYVDRMVVYTKRTVIRKWPALIGWTTPLLRDREKTDIEASGFGLGYLDDKVNKKTSNVEEIRTDACEVHQSQGEDATEHCETST
ncbi:unnamed protein product, partial [Cuscuta epithymum]